MFRQVHVDLVNLCKLNNNLFDIHLLISIISSAFNVTALIYLTYTYIVYIYSPEKSEINQILVWVTYILFYLIKILAINHICSITSDEVCNKFQKH